MKRPGGFTAAIFDMDGVLVNTEPHHIVIEKSLFRKLKLDISDEEHKDYLGKSALQMWSEIRERYGLPDSPEELASMNIRSIHDYFTEYKGDLAMPGSVEILDLLKMYGIRLSLASGSDVRTIDILLERTGLKGYFDHIVSSEITGTSKPDPGIYLYTLGLMEVRSTECFVVEDSPHGIKAARAAGLYCVAFRADGSNSIDQSMADLVIDDLKLISDLVK